MPNWVMGRLTISGPNVKNVIDQITTKVKYEDGEEKTNFDFNKIIPMPKELEIISGSLTDRAIEVYLTSINPEVNYFGEEKLAKEEFKELLQNLNIKKAFRQYEHTLSSEKIKELTESYQSDSDLNDYNNSLIKYGKHAIENLQKYGHLDWYSWSNANWGTKWNACHTHIESDNQIYFDTAWADVRDLMSQLSSLFPEHEFKYEWAEEQIGYYAGYAVFKNGEWLEEIDFEEHSKEAYELCFDIYGGEDSYRFNEAKGTYEYIEDESEGEME
jgi:hypothetical protein